MSSLHLASSSSCWKDLTSLAEKTAHRPKHSYGVFSWSFLTQPPHSLGKSDLFSLHGDVSQERSNSPLKACLRREKQWWSTSNLKLLINSKEIRKELVIWALCKALSVLLNTKMSKENHFLVKEMEEADKQITVTAHDCIQGLSCSYSTASRTNSSLQIQPALGLLTLAVIFTHSCVFHWGIPSLPQTLYVASRWFLWALQH